MAGGQERVLRGRIKSVQSTKKITRAMELIAAARIVKAMNRIKAARPYYLELSEVVRDLANAGSLPKSAYLDPLNPGGAKGLIVVSSDRGLCGAYNSSSLRLAEGEYYKETDLGRDCFLSSVGKKADNFFRYRAIPLQDSILGVTDSPTYLHASQVANSLLSMYENGELAEISVVSVRFFSAGLQRMERTQLVPLERELILDGSRSSYDFEFEPSPELIVDPLLRQFVLAKLFALLLEASAAEHASRQRAMKAATDNAEELIKGLSRTMNRARQDTITTEIMEIAGGAEALRAKSGSREV